MSIQTLEGRNIFEMKAYLAENFCDDTRREVATKFVHLEADEESLEMVRFSHMRRRDAIVIVKINVAVFTVLPCIRKGLSLYQSRSPLRL